MDNQVARFEKKLRDSLAGYVRGPEIRGFRDEFYKVILVVVSPQFEGMEEADRQELVWQRVLDTFEVEERRWIGFIYTDAPSEVEQGPNTDPVIQPAHRG